jgi:hypothetical protein
LCELIYQIYAKQLSPSLFDMVCLHLSRDVLPALKEHLTEGEDCNDDLVRNLVYVFVDAADYFPSIVVSQAAAGMTLCMGSSLAHHFHMIIVWLK